MAARRVLTTQIGIVGGGPAGLMLSHLLQRAGIDSIVIEIRDHDTIAATHRAGILEHGAVKMLTDTGVNGKVLENGHRHDGIDLRFGGESHRIDFPELVGESVWLYPQNDVFVDLAAARARDGGQVHYSVTDTAVLDVDSETPRIHFTDVDGVPSEIRCQILVGADGSRSIARKAMPESVRQDFFIEYPFAWFGILTEAPPSAPELIYANSEHGFALISQRNERVQRMYFQCDPGADASAWGEEQIWDELQRRVDGPDGFELKRGPIFEQMVLPFRSYVREPLSYANLFLAGDAGHTVPPTGAKGLNLAFHDVKVLFEALDSYFSTGSRSLLEGYSDTALARIWKAQHFSYWMTSMLHTRSDASPFDRRRVIGELNSVVTSRYGQQYLAEGYTGWPSQ